MFSLTPGTVRRLLAYVKPGASDQNECFSPSDTSNKWGSANNNLVEDEGGVCVEKAVKSLVKKLKKGCQLEELEKAIINEDENTKCVTIPRSLDGRLQIQHKKVWPHVMYCRLWRWPDLTSQHELQHIEKCSYAFHHKKDDVCINPYHYFRLENPHFLSQPLELDSVSSFQGKNPSVLVPRISSSTLSTNMGMTVDHRLSNYGFLATTSGSGLSNIDKQVTARHQMLNVPINTNLPFVKPQREGSSAEALPIPPHSLMCNTMSFTSAKQLSAASAGSPTAIGSPMSSSGASVASPSAYYSEDNADYCGEQAMEQDHTREQSSNALSTLSQQHQMVTSIIPQPSPMDSYLIHYRDLDTWCSLHYYEMQHRVGDTFHVRVNNVQIDGGTCPSDISRFCLGSLNNANRSIIVEKARRFIGRGIRLTYQDGEVTAKCESQAPIFVQSPNCNLRRDWHPATVCRIPPECNFSIFRNIDFRDQLNSSVQRGYEAVYALTKMCTIRVSFVKGWGAEYQRQSITATPCWLEIHLNGPLQWLDQVLYAMGSPQDGCSSMS